ncbi:hypothetical protein ACWEWX_35175, partial [Streptomyces asiaticus]
VDWAAVFEGSGARRVELPTYAFQREIVEEALLHALVSAGRCEAARDRLEERLDRRSSPHDRRRLMALSS